MYSGIYFGFFLSKPKNIARRGLLFVLLGNVGFVKNVNMVSIQRSIIFSFKPF